MADCSESTWRLWPSRSSLRSVAADSIGYTSARNAAIFAFRVTDVNVVGCCSNMITPQAWFLTIMVP